MHENNSYKPSSLVSLITSYKSKISYKAGPCPHNQCDQKIEKNHPISDKKWPNQLPRQKKSQNRNNKAQFESEQNQHQTTFGTLKYLQKNKKRTAYLGENVESLIQAKLFWAPFFAPNA